ncbi:CDPK-related kinase 3 [Zea mays]|uniref:CDPK-related kinase 3 n=1 Tax=Zea mays TaxID=4577 RepID=A0A1D6GN22_MAIZE|nr:CDPK-related kinase 3 [Zea mays]
MGQCYARNVHGVDADDGGVGATTITVSAAGGPEDAASVGGGGGRGGGRRSARPSPAGTPRGGRAGAGATPARSSAAGSPWAPGLPDGIAPSPATSVSTPRRFFRRPFPPPSPAKHIKASLARRLGHRSPASASQVPMPPVEVPIQEHGAGGAGGGAGQRELDKSFGYDRQFAAKYELGKEVGRGHFGHTCLVRARKGDMRGQVLAVKVISKAKMTTAISIEDVRREVKILKALSGHSNLVKFYDACEDALNVYIIMELCEGGELLDRILSRGGRYNEGDAKIIVEQILKVVAFCHLQGVVHRDLKPENFLFSTREEHSPMKIIDFGLSDFIRPAHPWLRDEQQQIPLDMLVFKLVKAYLVSTPLKRAALKALSRAITQDELIYIRAQYNLLEPNSADGRICIDNFRMALLQNCTDAMKESRTLEILHALEPLAYRRMDFEEFRAATISPYQLEAVPRWEEIASTAFGYFEQEGNRAITIEELAQEMNLSAAAYSVVRDWIRPSDGKLSFLGYTKFLHGLTMRSGNARRHH